MAKHDYSVLLQNFEIRENRLNSKIDFLQRTIDSQSEEIKQLEQTIEHLRIENRHKQEYIDRLISYSNLNIPQESTHISLKQRLYKIFHR
jgi:hypothetical protein